MGDQVPGPASTGATLESIREAIEKWSEDQEYATATALVLAIKGMLGGASTPHVPAPGMAVPPSTLRKNLASQGAEDLANDLCGGHPGGPSRQATAPGPKTKPWKMPRRITGTGAREDSPPSFESDDESEAPDGQ